MSIDIICDVIDNFGDAGVCLRLGRDLAVKGKKVRIFCNNIDAINRITTTNDLSMIGIFEWPECKNAYEASEVIIQAFSVRLPKCMMEKVKEKKSLIINIEYLTAEKFAEDCHKLPSYADGLESFFFFPGFTEKTGSVVIEDSLRKKIKDNENKSQNNISVFSYENNKLLLLINKLNKINSEFKFLIFEGKSLNIFNKQTKLNLKPNEQIHFKDIKVNALKMVNHEEYDDILIKSSINLVRGEDSIVRAMLVGKPFLWNIYPTDDNAHFDKINALFDIMKEKLELKKEIDILRNITLSYNGFSDYLENFDFLDFYDIWKNLSSKWSEYLLSHDSLTNNLLSFIGEKLSKDDK